VVPQPGRQDVAAEGLTLRPADRPGAAAGRAGRAAEGARDADLGASGSGKSTLFRALAGIWPFGRGHVNIPAGARVLFLPQKPYIPIGTLRDAVKYPDEESKATDAEIVSALEAGSARHLTQRLDEDTHWSNILSGGEQQRLAVARALVFKPDWLFMDEATASLDEPAEAAVYRRLKERLPTTTMVSIAIARPCGNGTTGGSSCSARPARSAGWSSCRAT
jgi:putative ATP-binding cassette transporter